MRECVNDLFYAWIWIRIKQKGNKCSSFITKWPVYVRECVHCNLISMPLLSGTFISVSFYSNLLVFSSLFVTLCGQFLLKRLHNNCTTFFPSLEWVKFLTSTNPISNITEILFMRFFLSLFVTTIIISLYFSLNILGHIIRKR